MTMLEKKQFHVVDYLVLLLSLLSSSLIGIFFAWVDRKKQNNAEFLQGGKQLGLFPVSLSLIASFMSSITVLAYPAEMYTQGTQFWMSAFGSFIATIIAGELFLPVFYRLQLVTVTNYIEKRYNSALLRKLVSMSNCIVTLLYLGVQLYAPAVAIEAVTNIPIPTSILVIGLICTFYTSVGGVKAVVWTDVIQMTVMFLGMLLVAIKGTWDTGGTSEVWKRADQGGRVQFFNFESSSYNSNTFWNAFFGMGFLWLSGNGLTQQQIQRYCSLPTMRRARLSVYINMIGVFLTLTLSFICGVVLYAFYHGCDPVLKGYISSADQIMPYYVLERMNVPGIPGLFVSSVFSGSLSTLSSGYNSLSALVWEDFLSPYLNVSEKNANRITKLVAVLFGLTSIALGFVSKHVGAILQASLAIGASATGPLTALYLLGVTVPWCNRTGAITAYVSSILVCFWVVVGRIAFEMPKPNLLTSVDFCLPNVTHAFSTANSSVMVFAEKPVNEVISPTGIFRLYHLSPLVMPMYGIFVTVVLALLISFLTGGNNEKEVDPSLLNQTCNKYLSWKPPSLLKLRSKKQKCENIEQKFMKIPTEDKDMYS